jgi:hypothetical protein
MVSLENRGLLHALYRHLWDLKEEAGLVRGYVAWLENDPKSRERFFSSSHQPGTYRGGLIADLQRLLPMDEQGGFSQPNQRRRQSH